MATTIANVIAGRALVGFDKSPDLTTPGNNVYVDVGYTESPTKFEYKSEQNEVIPEQETFPIKSILATEELLLKFVMHESSLANLHLGYGGADISGAVITLGPFGGSTLKEIALRMTGPATGGLTRTVIIPRATIIGTTAVEIAKAKEQMIEVTARCLRPSDSVSVCTVTDA
jgi:hypothetical protein